MSENRDVLGIRGLEVQCVVGVYPRERDTLQPLTVDVELVLDTQAAAESGKLSRSLDYDAVARQVEAVLVGCRFRLLETAAHALCSLLLAPPAPGERRASARSVAIKLQKPEALAGRAVAGLTVQRDASWLAVARASAPFGAVEVLLDTREAGVYRLVIDAGRQARLPSLPRGAGAAFSLSDGLSLDSRGFRARSLERLDGNRPHVVQNTSRGARTLLLVTCQQQRVLEGVQAERRTAG
ncbi:MAG: dihydroneopterin aldolase [Polyangiaceae bacterium]|nr:dihydroneopterin aldolase [Polyangiaceae bacterium]